MMQFYKPVMMEMFIPQTINSDGIAVDIVGNGYRYREDAERIARNTSEKWKVRSMFVVMEPMN